MAINAAELVVEIGANTQNAEQGFDRVGGKINGFVKNLGVVGLELSGAFTAPLVAVAKMGVEFLSMKQQAQIAFTTMLHDGEKAKAFLADLQDFAAKTPFEFEGLVTSSKKLLAMGFTAQQVRPMLTAIGDAVAGLGGGKDVLEGVSLALGQMKAKGKVSAEEMNQLAERGIPAWQFVADKIGKSIPEAMQMAQKGAIKADEAIGALIDGMNNKFGGMMEKQAHTFQGLLSTLSDTSKIIAAEMLEPVFEKVSAILDDFTNNTLPGLIDAWRGLSPEVKTAVLAFAGILAAAGPVALAIAGITAIVSALASPVGAAIAIVAALGVAYSTNFMGIRDTVNDTVQELIRFYKEHQEAFKTIWEAVKLIVKVVVEQVVANLGGLLTAVQGILKILNGDWKSGWELLQQAAVKINEAMVNAILGVLKGLVGLVIGLLGLIATPFKQAWEGIKEAAVSVWTSIKETAASIWGGIIRFFTETIPQALIGLVNWFAELPGKIGEYLAALPEKVLYYFGFLAATGIGLVRDFVTGVVDFFANLPARVIGFLTNLATGAIQLFTQLKDGAISLAGGLIDGVINWFSNLPVRIGFFVIAVYSAVSEWFNKAKTFAIETAKTLVEGVKEFLGNIPEYIKTIWGAVLDFLGGLPGKVFSYAFNIGKSIFKGFDDGIDKHSPTGPEKTVKKMVEGISLDLDRSGPKLKGAAASSAKEIDKAFKDALKPVEDYLKSVGVQIELTRKVWGTFTAETKKLLNEKVAAIQAASKAESDAALKLEQDYRVSLTQINEWLKAKGATHTQTARDIMELSERERAAVISAAGAWTGWGKVMEEAAKRREILQKAFPQLYPPILKEIEVVGQLDEATKKMAKEASEAFEKLTETQIKELDRQRKEQEKLIQQADELGRRLPSSWNAVIDGVLKAQGKYGESLTKSQIETKEWAGAILGVIDTLPGKFGDVARRVVDTVEKWAEFTNSVLNLLNKFNSKIPGTLEGLIKTIYSKWQGGFDKIFGTLKDWGKKIGDFFTSDLGAIIGGAGIFIGSKFIGGVTGHIVGALGGALSGAKIGSMIAPGIGTAIGAIGGAILGGIFGGKSKEQKEAEKQQQEATKQQLEQLKQDVAKGTQEVLQAGLKTVQDALDTLDKFLDYAPVSKKLINRFMVDLRRIAAGLVEVAGQFKSESLTAVKAFAESVGPAVELIGKTLEVFDKLLTYIPPAEATIRSFGKGLELILRVVAEVAESLEKSLLKHARKLAQLAGETVEFIGKAVEAFTGLSDYKGISAEIFEAFKADIQLAIAKMGEVAEMFDLGAMKITAKFAERAGVIVSAIGGAVEAFKGLLEYQSVAHVLGIFGQDLEAAIVLMENIASRTDAEFLGRAVAFSNGAKLVAEAIAAGVGALKAVGELTAVPQEAFDAFYGGMSAVMDLTAKLIERARAIAAYAKIFKDEMSKAAADMSAGAQSLASILATLGGTPQAITVGASSAITPQGVTYGGGQTYSRGSESPATQQFSEGAIQINVNPSDIDGMNKLMAFLNQLKQAGRAR
jgi:tape measure domain-containing protein